MDLLCIPFTHLSHWRHVSLVFTECHSFLIHLSKSLASHFFHLLNLSDSYLCFNLGDSRVTPLEGQIQPLPPPQTHPVLFPVAPLALVPPTPISLCYFNFSLLAFHLEICSSFPQLSPPTHMHTPPFDLVLSPCTSSFLSFGPELGKKSHHHWVILSFATQSLPIPDSGPIPTSLL